MEFSVIRSKAKAEALCRKIMQLSLPFKIAIQEVFPVRSIEANDYYWGFVVTPIANETGLSIEEVHEGYRIKFNYTQEFRYNRKTRKMQFYIGAGTTVVDERKFWEFVMKVRADAELELHLTIMMPNEAFTNELKFRHQTKKI